MAAGLSVELLWWHGMVEALEGKCWTGSVVVTAWLITWQYLLTWCWLGWWHVNVNYFFLEGFCFLTSLPFVIRCCSWQWYHKRACICDFAWDRRCEERSYGVVAGWWVCCGVDLLLLLRATTLWTRANEDLLRCLVCGPQISDGCDGFYGWLVDELL